MKTETPFANNQLQDVVIFTILAVLICGGLSLGLGAIGNVVAAAFIGTIIGLNAKETNWRMRLSVAIIVIAMSVAISGYSSIGWHYPVAGLIISPAVCLVCFELERK